MPWLNWPNRITIVRILLIVPLIMCLLKLSTEDPPWMRYAALVLFCLVAGGDALDGYLARRLKEETPLGRFLDPLADKLLMTSCMILLALPQTAVPGARLPSWVPVLTIGKDVLLTIGFSLVYATTGRYFIQPRPLGKICTMLQSMLIPVVLLAPDLPAWYHNVFFALCVTVAGCAVLATVDYLWIGNRFARNVHLQELSKGPNEP
jgi:cardiolipin synthase